MVIEYTVSERDGPVGPVFVRRLRALDTGPLWFILVLLLVSFAYVAWRHRVPRTASELASLSRVLIRAAALIAVASFVVRLAWPIDSHQIFDLHVWLWPQCVVLFSVGALSAERVWLQPVPGLLRRSWAAAAGLSAVVLVVVLTLAGGDDEELVLGGWHWQALLGAACEGVVAVGASLWVLGLFQRRFDRQGRLTRQLSRSAYGAFVVQAPVLVGLALGLHCLAAPADLGLLALAVGAVMGSFAIALGSRRLPTLRRPQREPPGR